MAKILNETFLIADNYDDGDWTESVGAGCSIDEGAATHGSAPADWGSYSLYFDRAAGQVNKAYNTLAAEQNIAYLRVEFIMDAESLANGNNVRIIRVYEDGGNVPFAIYFRQNAAGNYIFFMNCFYDGSTHTLEGFPTLSLDTRYRIEVKWDKTNDVWAWRIDGVNQPNNVDATDPVESEGTLSGTAADWGMYDVMLGCDNNAIDGADSDAAYTAYFDNIAVDDADWVGAEAAGISIPVAMDYYRQMRS